MKIAGNYYGWFITYITILIPGDWENKGPATGFDEKDMV